VAARGVELVVVGWNLADVVAKGYDQYVRQHDLLVDFCRALPGHMERMTEKRDRGQQGKGVRRIFVFGFLFVQPDHRRTISILVKHFEEFNDDHPACSLNGAALLHHLGKELLDLLVLEGRAGHGGRTLLRFRLPPDHGQILKVYDFTTQGIFVRQCPGVTCIGQSLFVEPICWLIFLVPILAEMVIAAYVMSPEPITAAVKNIPFMECQSLPGSGRNRMWR
jgi:hypothetical protein